MYASDEPDFESFLRRHLPTLAGYARLLAGNRHDAEDLLAETLVEALRRWPRIRLMEHPLAYVRTMVTTRHIGRQRRWFRRTEVLVDTDDQTRGDPDEAPFLAVADRAELETLLQDLPPRQRAALVLRFYCDLPYTDVGRELGVTAAGARTAVFRALAALRPTRPAEDLR